MTTDLSEVVARPPDTDDAGAIDADAERKAWVEKRREFLGASEVAAVVGLDPYRTALDVWALKTGVAVQDDAGGAAAVGTELEAPVLRLYARRHGISQMDLHRPGTIVIDAERWIAATPDAVLLGPSDTLSPFSSANFQRDVQVKVVGLRMARRWGEESDGVAGVPEYVVAQVHWEMLVLGVREADVVALLGTDLRTYRVERDDELIEMLVEVCRDFWTRCVLGGEMPMVDGSERTRRILEARFPTVRGDLLPAPAEVVDLARLYGELRLTETTAAREKDRIGNLLRLAAGDGAGFVGDFGEVTWREEKGRPSWKQIALAMSPPAALVKQHTTPQRALRVRLKGSEDDHE